MNKIEPNLLMSYEKLVERQRNGLAVVKVSRSACGGCFNIVPPQRQAEIKEKKKIILSNILQKFSKIFLTAKPIHQ